MWQLPLVLALIVAAYWNGLGNGFVWLDQSEILERVLIVDDWDQALGLFLNDRNNAGYHRPIYSLMHSLDWALWGNRPFGFLLSSLVLHLANVALVFHLLRRVSGGSWTPMLIALFWGLHPINSAVAGLIHSKADLLYVFGVLVSANCFCLATYGRDNSADEGRSASAHRLAWGIAILAFALALLSKENALLYPVLVSFGVLCPGLLGGFGESSSRRANLRRYAGLLWVLVLVVLALRWSSMRGQNYPSELSLPERLLTFAGVYSGYLQGLVLPLKLSICDTVTRYSALGGRAQLHLGLAFAAAIGFQIWAAVRLPRLRPWLLLYNLALLPVAQVIPALHFRADRFLYLPSLAFVGAVVVGVRTSLEHLREAGRKSRALAIAIPGLIVLWCVLAMGRTALRTGDFRSDETLFRTELAHTPDYLEGLSVLGRTLDRHGHHESAAELLKLSLQEYPGRISYLDRGGVALAYSFNLLARGRVLEARNFLEGADALVVKPIHRQELDYNMAVARFRLGEFSEALKGFQHYARIHPDDASCHFFLGKAAVKAGQPDLAAHSLRRYLSLAPGARDRAEVEALLAQLDG